MADRARYRRRRIPDERPGGQLTQWPSSACRWPARGGPPLAASGLGSDKAHKHVPAYDLLVQHSTLFNWLRLKIGNLAAQRAAAREAARAVPPSTEGERGEPRELERWRLTAAIFERLRAQADSHGVPLIVAIIPHGGTLKEYYARGRDADVDRMLQICGEHRLRCVNVSESIRRSRPAINSLSLYEGRTL